MAALQERKGRFRLIFRYHDKQHTFTIGHIPEDEAQATAASGSCWSRLHRVRTHGSSPLGELQPRPGGQHSLMGIGYPAAQLLNRI